MVRVMRGGGRGMTTKKFTNIKDRIGGGVGAGGDARLKIIAKKRSQVTDARDKLASLAKTTDARQKLEKIRNFKEGKLDVKTTAKGGIQIVTKTNGTLQLTTKKKIAKKAGPNTGAAKSNAPAQNRPVQGRQQGAVQNNRRGMNQAPSQNIPAALGRNAASAQRAAPLRGVTKNRTVPAGRRGGRIGGVGRDEGRLTRTILSEAAILDEELLNTHVDPFVLKRTIRQQRPQSQHYRRSPEPLQYDSRPPLFTRGRSPEYDDYATRPIPPSFSTIPPVSRARYDYDDIRREQEREDEIYRRRLLQEQQAAAEQLLLSRTMADRVAETGGNFNSPIQGTKVVVSNLQSTVSQDDIVELFGDIGALKRGRVTAPGTAEVVYVNKADALKAVEVYHNRQLDGKAMKCSIVGASNTYESKVASALPRSVGGIREAPAPDMTAIHKALFLAGKRPATTTSSRPQFTVTMAKNGSRY